MCPLTVSGEDLGVEELVPFLWGRDSHDGDGVLGPQGQPGERVRGVFLKFKTRSVTRHATKHFFETA